MRLLGRTATVLGLACLVLVAALSAQTTGFETFKWYIGGQAGVTIFETQSQTRSGIFTAGGNMLVTAKRTGLLITVEEGFARNQVSRMTDNSVVPPAQVQVLFNDIRKFSFSLLAFPLRSAAQPYFGVGAGFMQTVKEYPQGTTPANAAALQDLAERTGSYGFGSLTAGVQFRVARFVVFGQGELTSSPASDKLLVGPTLAFTGGMRFSLGSAREGVSGAGAGSD
jgi:hypothetical protein